jgi:hypothetical protein
MGINYVALEQCWNDRMPAAHHPPISGFDLHNGSELLRVGQALRVLPRIAEAFGAGRLSFDKVRQITTVASPATE